MLKCDQSLLLKSFASTCVWKRARGKAKFKWLLATKEAGFEAVYVEEAEMEGGSRHFENE